MKGNYSQNIAIASGKFDEEKEYWLNQLAGELTVTEFPLDFPRLKTDQRKVEKIDITFPDQVFSQIARISNRSEYAVYMILVAGINYLMSRYTGNEDIIVGTPIFQTQFEESVLNHVLTLRNQINGSMTFKDLLAKVKQTILGASKNQNYPFSDLIHLLNIPAQKDRFPLSTVLVMMENIQNRKYLETYHGDLLFSFLATQTNLTGAIEYDADLFRQETIEQLANHLIRFFELALGNVENTLDVIDILSEEEKHRILLEFNATQVEYPRSQTIHQLFERQVAETPDQVAVVFQNREFTYRELNQRANQLARVLRAKGVSKNQVVGICLRHSLEMIIGVLAIVKAGGVYLPLDVDYPKKRIEFMLQDSAARLLLTANEFVDLQFAGEILDPGDIAIYHTDPTNLENINDPDDLIYIIYTSGSTGNPKGVMVTHRNVNRLISHSNMLKIDQNERILQTGSLAFDASTFEIWGSLLNGATLYLVERNDILSIDRLREHLKSYQITMMWLTAPLFNQLLEGNPAIFAHLQTLLVGGDALSAKHINTLKSKYPDLTIINGYGPTESTTFTTYYVIPDHHAWNIPIGKPVSNTRVYILDRKYQLQPIGVQGELCIAGDGLAKGYLNQPELTAEKFVDNPFEPGEKMYRSGDLVRWLPDGNIEFVGRMDHQVKIRGFRIELNEIEKQLLKHSAVREALVIDRLDVNQKKYICAYLVFKEECTVADLRDYLSEELPDYMIPAYFIQLDKMPLTANGKIDRKSLPEPDTNPQNTVDYVAPRTEVEKELAEIWETVLDANRVGIYDNFFEIGGDSIKAIQILVRANRKGINVSIDDIFKYKTIADILENVDLEQKLTTEQNEVVGEVPFTPRQHWLCEQKKDDLSRLYQTITLSLNKNVNVELLGRAFEKVIEHHDALRMTYIHQNDGFIQYNQRMSEVNFKLDYYDLSNESDRTQSVQREKIAKMIEQNLDNLDLQQGLLLKAMVFDLGDQEKVLCIAVHQLVIDAFSWRILLEDLHRLYGSALREGLPAKTTSFKEWSEKVTNDAETKMMDVKYWEKYDFTQTPTIREMVERNGEQKATPSVRIELDERHTEELLNEVHWVYNTEIEDILLSALSLAMMDLTGGDSALLNIETRSGQEILPDMDLTRSIGSFANVYPIYFTKQEGLNETIKHVKESLRRVPNNGRSYGVARYLQQHPLLCNLNPEITFCHVGQFAANMGEDAADELFTAYQDDLEVMADQIPGLIWIQSKVVNGKFQINGKYDRSFISGNTVKNLMERYEGYLQEIIQHCLQKSEKEYTVSDFAMEDLWDDDDLNQIAELYEL